MYLYIDVCMISFVMCFLFYLCFEIFIHSFMYLMVCLKKCGVRMWCVIVVCCCLNVFFDSIVLCMKRKRGVLSICFVCCVYVLCICFCVCWWCCVWFVSLLLCVCVCCLVLFYKYVVLFCLCFMRLLLLTMFMDVCIECVVICTKHINIYK